MRVVTTSFGHRPNDLNVNARGKRRRGTRERLERTSFSNLRSRHLSLVKQNIRAVGRGGTEIRISPPIGRKKEAKQATIKVALGCAIEARAACVEDRKVIARRSSKFTVARDEKVTVTFPGRHLLAAAESLAPLSERTLS